MFATWDLTAEQLNENLAMGERSIDVKRRIAHAMFTAQLRHRHTACRRIAMICASVYLLFFIQILLRHLAEKILLIKPLNFGGG